MMESIQTQPRAAQAQASEPWQLKIFRRSLKKQQKRTALLRMLDDVRGQACLLITCGDNNGALNWHFKQHGGNWTWADAEHESTQQISILTGDPVLTMDKDKPLLPVADNQFDVVMTIDVHEHLREVNQLNRELARIVKRNGRVIVTTPGGEPGKLANRLKHWLGMRTQDYGHVVDGYAIHEHQAQLREVGLIPVASSSYSRFFTELAELMINFAYVKVLAKKSKAKVEQGQIAPQNQDQLKSVEKSYKMYSRIYPLLWAFSMLDNLIRSRQGYAVIVAARKA
jgi:ubiquinone/menaquinone biosynthesis C-methylase UbiE